MDGCIGGIFKAMEWTDKEMVRPLGGKSEEEAMDIGKQTQTPIPPVKHLRWLK